MKIIGSGSTIERQLLKVLSTEDVRELEKLPHNDLMDAYVKYCGTEKYYEVASEIYGE